MKTIIKTAFVAFAIVATMTAFAKSSGKSISVGGITLDPGDTITFAMDEDDLPETIGGAEVLTEYLPLGIEVEWTGKKFKTPKAGSPKVKKVDGDYEITVSDKGSDNPCSLKISHKKNGSVSGSFKVYTATENSKGKPKLKSYSAKFSGTIGRTIKGSIKKGGSFTATLE